MWKLISDVFLSHFPIHILRQGLLVNLKLVSPAIKIAGGSLSLLPGAHRITGKLACPSTFLREC